MTREPGLITNCHTGSVFYRRLHDIEMCLPVVLLGKEATVVTWLL